MAKSMSEREPTYTPVAKTIERILVAIAKPENAEKVKKLRKEEALKKAQQRQKEIFSRFNREKNTTNPEQKGIKDYGEEEIRKAKEITEELKSSGQHASSNKWVRENRYGISSTPDTLSTAKIQLETARKIAGHDNSPLGNINPEDLQHSSVAAYALAEWSMLPPELRKNPNVALTQAARLAASVNADMSVEELNEIRRVLNAFKSEIRTLRDDPDRKDGFNIEDRKLDNILSEMVGGIVTDDKFVLFDPATEFTGTLSLDQSNLKTLLQDYNIQLDILDPNDDEAIKLLEKFRLELAGGTYRKIDTDPKNKSGTRTVPIDRDKARPYIDKLKTKIEELQEKQKIMRQEQYIQEREAQESQMWLKPSEELHFGENPEEVLEGWMRRIYAERSMGTEDVANMRLRLFQSFLVGDTWKALYIKFHPAEFPKGMSQARIDSHIESVRERLFEFTEKSMMLKFAASSIWDGSKNFEQAVNVLRRVGSRGWEIVYMGNNGMNGKAYEILEEELSIVTTNPKPGEMPLRLSSELLERALQNTRNRIERNKTQYKEIFGKKVTTEDINHFVRAGEVLADVRQKVVLAVMRGRGPGERPLSDIEPPSSSFRSTSYAENIAAVMDWYRYGPEKWGYLTEGAKRELEFSCEFMGTISGFDSTVDLEIAKLRADGSYRTERDKTLKERWGEHYENWKETKHIDMHLASFVAGTGLSGEIADQEYRRLLMVGYGKKRLGELLEMYDVDSSGWRIAMVLQENVRFFKDADTRALGYWLRYAGNDFLRAEAGEADDVFRNGAHNAQKQLDEVRFIENGVTLKAEWNDDFSVYNVLKRIGKYESHWNGLWLYEKGNEEFVNWWNSAPVQEAARKLTGLAGDVDYIQAYRSAIEKHSLIIGIGDKTSLPVVDYSEGIAGLTPEQKRAVSKAFGCSVNQVDTNQAVQNHFSFMGELSKQVLKDEELMAFKDPRYRQYFKRTQFTGDARLGMIEDLERLPEGAPGSTVRTGAKAKSEAEAKIKRYSTISTAEGEGSTDQMVRAWNDLSTFGMQLPILLKSIYEATNEKTLLEGLTKLVGTEEPYAGKQDALLASTAILAGYGRMGKVESFWVDLWGMDNLPWTTESKRYLGDMGMVLQHRDLHQLKEKWELIQSRLELYPELKPVVEALDGYWGSSWKRLDGVRKGLPFMKDEVFWLMQSKNAVFIGAGILIALLGKEAFSSMGASTSGGESHHS